MHTHATAERGTAYSLLLWSGYHPSEGNTMIGTRTIKLIGGPKDGQFLAITGDFEELFFPPQRDVNGDYAGEKTDFIRWKCSYYQGEDGNFYYAPAEII